MVFKYTTYTISLGVCITLAILLLLIKDKQTGTSKSYIRIRHLQAYSMLLYSLINALTIVFICLQQESIVLDSIIVPFIYYLQLMMVTLSVFKLIGTQYATKRNTLLLFLPLFVLFFIYLIIMSFENNGISHLLNQSSYEQFTTTNYHQIFCYALYTILFIELFILNFWLFSDLRTYRRKLKNYFSNEGVTKGNTITHVAYCFDLYFIIAGADLIITGDLWDPIFTVISTILLIACTIMVINLKSIYMQIKPAMLLDDEKKENGNEENNENDKHKSSTIEPTMSLLINDWTKREPHPFLEEKITLASVAEAINVSPRLLSEFLNKFFNMNFNAWINSLRIEDVKKIIEKKPEMTLSQIATCTGFTDQAALCKIFKRYTGVTPSTYKKEIKA